MFSGRPWQGLAAPSLGTAALGDAELISFKSHFFELLASGWKHFTHVHSVVQKNCCWTA